MRTWNLLNMFPLLFRPHGKMRKKFCLEDPGGSFGSGNLVEAKGLGTDKSGFGTTVSPPFNPISTPFGSNPTTIVPNPTPTPTGDCRREGQRIKVSGLDYICTDSGVALVYLPEEKANEFIAAKKKMEDFYTKS